MIRGYSYDRALDEVIAGTTAKEGGPTTSRISSKYSHYATFVQIEKSEGGWQLLEQIHDAVLTYVYSGQPRYFIGNDLQLVEKGLCRMRYILPFEHPRLERVKSGEISIDKLVQQEQEIIPGRAESIMISVPFSGLAAFIDEPLVIKAAISFFHDRHKMIDAIYQTMASFKSDPAIIGKLWERCIPEEMERIFDGTKKLVQLTLFRGLEDLDLPWFFEFAEIVTPTKPRFPNVKLFLSSSEYNLSKYLQDDAASRPAFFAPDNFAGPDIIFFVQIRGVSGEIHLPVLVQVKLRNHVDNASLRTTDPDLLYHDKNGNMIDVERTVPLLRILKQRSQHGIIRIMITYPANFPGSPMVINSHNYETRSVDSRIRPQLIGIIDSRNISELFSERHVSYLKYLKDSNNS
ncbi:uncharacterized protein VTP21DRAFT_10271 [Calcarisporiella thermophila]|uniref:uncharacterized protein n=1 Tax=Calcarisporiella thermophila TaxID=911321 RepID=UPI003744A797